jgi:tetratricopeptide (TPR) repeat protein
MVDLAELYQLALLFGLWTAAALLFLLATKWRKTPPTEEGELSAGSRLGDGESQREPEVPFDPADRRTVRRTALEHGADRSQLSGEGQRVARRRTLQLIARIQLQPNDLTLRRQLIQDYLDGQDKVAAIQQLLVLADILEEQGDVEGAKDCLRQVLDLDPADEHAQRRLGLRGAESVVSGTGRATFPSGSTPSGSSA